MVVPSLAPEKTAEARGRGHPQCAAGEVSRGGEGIVYLGLYSRQALPDPRSRAGPL